MDYEKIYKYRFRDIDQKKKLLVWRVISHFIYDLMGKPQRVLDPCAGDCEFLMSIDTKERWAVDQQPVILNFENSGLKCIVGNIFEVELPTAYFQGIFVSNFLEHLSNPAEVSQFLRKMYNSLEPNGTLIIMGPNFKFCPSTYFDCCDHTLILTHVSVAEFLSSENFTIEKIYPKFLPFSFRSILPASALLTKIYLNFPLVWNILGKQFLLVAKKPLVL